MRKNKIFLIALLLINSAYADTKPMHFDIGDIAPRQKIKFNVNTPQWPGYHDIQCDIIDPSSAAIIRISSENSAAQIVEINQVQYNSLPIQISLKDQQNKLTLYKTFNFYDSSSNGTNDITFENLDDDVTISIKNCEISPTALLSADFTYIPSKVTCAGGTCKIDGASSDKWEPILVSVDGTYYFTSASYYMDQIVANYYSSNFMDYVQLGSNNYIPAIELGSSWVLSGSSGTCMPQSTSVANCPLKNNNTVSGR